MKIFDCHTHNPESANAVYVVPKGADLPQRPCCVGLHPWYVNPHTLVEDLQWVAKQAIASQVVAIGEVGLDRLQGEPLAVQIAAFATQLSIAQQVGKPVVIHTVRTASEVLSTLKKSNCHVPVIIHGFRGKPELAEAFLRAGCSLSFGQRFNPQTVRDVPPDRLLIETDDCSGLDITTVAQAVAVARGLDLEDLVTITNANAVALGLMPVQV